MKKIDLGQAPLSTSKKIASVIGKKLEENKEKISSKIDLGKIAEKLSERRQKALSETEE